MNARVKKLQYKVNTFPLMAAQSESVILDRVEGGAQLTFSLDVQMTVEEMTAAGFHDVREMVERIEQSVEQALQGNGVTPTPSVVIEQIFSGRKIVLDS